MKPERVAVLRGIVDLAYTALVIGVVTYTIRDELRGRWQAWRARQIAKRHAAREEAEREGKRFAFLATIRDDIIRAEHTE